MNVDPSEEIAFLILRKFTQACHRSCRSMPKPKAGKIRHLRPRQHDAKCYSFLPGSVGGQEQIDRAFFHAIICDVTDDDFIISCSPLPARLLSIPSGTITWLDSHSDKNDILDRNAEGQKHL